MSSRQQQKERRKREREERLRREKRAEQRKQLGQIISGVVIVAAMVIGVVMAAGGGGSGATGSAVEGEAPGGAPIQGQRIADLTRAANLAKCTYTAEFPDEGSEHVEDECTAKDYKTNPAVSGSHNPVPAQDGYYPRAQPPAVKNSVHTLEHGRVQFQYSRRLPGADERKLRSLYNEDISGAGKRYHAVLFQNTTSMPHLIAAVAWRSSLRCDSVNEYTWDALRAFYREKLDKGPEQVP